MNAHAGVLETPAPAVRPNAWQTAQLQFERVADRLALDAATRELLATPLREYHVSIPVDMDDGSTRVFRGYRVQHNDARGPAKGGVRFQASATVDDVRALAMWMSWKCALLDLPLGGGKGLVVCDPSALSEREQERLCRGWIRQLAADLGAQRDVPAPDMMTSARHMVWMLDEYETITGRREPGFITGKPVALGGAHGRTEATGYGAVMVLREALADLGMPIAKARLAIQGFGNVAQHAAERFAEMGGTVLAVSCWDRADQRAYTYTRTHGVNVRELQSMTDAFGSIDRRQAGRAGYDILNGQAWLELPVDIVMPAAREGQLTRDTVKTMGSHVRLVVEGANGPTTADGDAALEDAGIRVVPDVLANAGGVTCSYFEQVQGNTNYYWPREEVLERLDQRMTAAYRAVARAAADEGVSLREAASTIAIRRVVEACRLRGWV